MANTINNLWAGLSTNRLTFSEEEVGAGILYKGSVVSNQLNGIAYNLYEMVDFIQRTGGLYNSKKVYKLDNIVSIIRKDLSGPVRVEQYRCISTLEGGIVNTPPILRAVYDEKAKIPMFQGGVVDTANWVRCDVVGYGEIYQERTSFGNTDIKLFSVAIPPAIDSPNVKIEGKYSMVVYFEDKVSSFDISLEGSFTKTLGDEVILLPNRLGINAPEISFSNYRSNVTDYGEEGDFHKLMPCGIRFQYSEKSGETGIFLRVRDGVRKIVISGSGSYVDVNLNRDIEKIENYIVLPVRTGGGFGDFDAIGMIEQRDYNLPIEMQYKMGLFKLGASTTFNDEDRTRSPLWGKDSTETSALFSMFAKIRGSYKIPQWQGAFIRNLGENLIPGLPSNTPVRPIASFQGDAIRNITGQSFEGRNNVVSSPSSAFAINLGRQGGFNDGGTYKLAQVSFDASRAVPTSHDNHPSNVSTQFYYKAF